jgi:hypothetical protein
MDWAEFVAQHIPTPVSVQVEAYEGSGAYGDIFATAATVTPCVVEDIRCLVRVQTQDAAGAERVSSTTVFCPPGTTAPPGSRVTVPGRPPARVLAVARLDAHGLPLPSHLELSLE